MSDAFVTVDGVPAQACRLVVGNVGAWHVMADLESDAPIGGRVPVRVGNLTLTGTVDAAFSGTYALQRRVRVVAGAGGWSEYAPERSYHNDAGVKARLIAEDAARAVGETIGSFVPAAERVGVDYVRQAGPAVRTLEDAAGPGVAWWVDYDGVTHVGVRPQQAIPESAYEVVAYDPRAHVATLAIDDPADVQIGSTIAGPLQTPAAVRQLEINVGTTEIRAVVWLGGGEAEHDRLTGLLRAIVQRATDRRLFGPWRYRVVRMSGSRVDLQPVRVANGLPDLAAVDVWPGVASAHADLTPGAHVLVEFIEGDRAQPIVTHVTPRSGNGWVPVTVTIGGESGPPAARQGDAVEVLLPPAVFAGTINGGPATGVLTFPAMKALGTITAGSGKVKIA